MQEQLDTLQTLLQLKEVIQKTKGVSDTRIIKLYIFIGKGESIEK